MQAHTVYAGRGLLYLQHSELQFQSSIVNSGRVDALTRINKKHVHREVGGGRHQTLSHTCPLLMPLTTAAE